MKPDGYFQGQTLCLGAREAYCLPIPSLCVFLPLLSSQASEMGVNAGKGLPCFPVQ